MGIGMGIASEDGAAEIVDTVSLLDDFVLGGVLGINV